VSLELLIDPLKEPFDAPFGVPKAVQRINYVR